MRSYTAIVEQDTESKQYVGYVPGIPGAHSQADSLDELQANLQEVMEMIFEDGVLEPYADFVGTQQISVDANGQQTTSPQAR